MPVQKKQVSVEELEFGMYISELDRPWTDTPFMFQGFILNDDKQLETIRKFCKKVIIDLEKGSDLPDRSQLKTGPLKPRSNVESVLASIKQKFVYRETASVDQELPVARGPEQERSRREGHVRNAAGGQGAGRSPREGSRDEHDGQRRAQS